MKHSCLVCLKDKYGKFTHNNKGAAGVLVLFFVLFFIIAFGAVMQWMQVNTVKENIDRELSRAVNISIDLSMMDNYRYDRISRIDSDVAKDVFYLYLFEELGLDSDMNRYIDGRLQYHLEFETINIIESPPQFTVEGRVLIDPIYFKDLLDTKIEIPVKAKAKNQRLE